MKVVKICLLLLMFAALHASAAIHSVDSAWVNGDIPTVRESVLVQRDFPFLARILKDASVREALARDPKLQDLLQERQEAVASAIQNCSSFAPCEAEALLMTPKQIAQVSRELQRIYERNASVRSFVENNLQPVEEFRLDSSRQGEALFIANWARSAAGINLVIHRYGEGQPPKYGEDAGLYPVDSKTYGRLLQIILEDLPVTGPDWPNPHPTAALFFEPSLRFSVRLLEANSLDNAGRFWPLRSGVNAAAVKHLAAIHWANYPYSVIVVPGAGPQLTTVQLSPWGKERLRLAAKAYRSGAAPLLLVSGGFVHPPHTHYSEAIEMKRYLEQALGVPATSILVDPYARHTTTNLRNAVREMIHYGIPAHRQMLIVSDTHQIAYIWNQNFAKRCMSELGYLPVKLEKHLSATSLTALPLKESLFRDPQDPLDP